MPKYACFDHTQPSPQQIIGWYDTDLLDYGTNLPASEDLLLLTTQQWNDRASNLSGWAHDSGALVSYSPTPPTPSPTDLAQNMLNAGIQIASHANTALNGTYPCHQQSQIQDSGYLSAINAGLTLPDGVATVQDMSGMPHTFTPTEFTAYCGVKLTFLQTLNTIKGGGPGTLPSLPIWID